MTEDERKDKIKVLSKTLNDAQDYFDRCQMFNTYGMSTEELDDIHVRYWQAKDAYIKALSDMNDFIYGRND